MIRVKNTACVKCIPFSHATCHFNDWATGGAKGYLGVGLMLLSDNDSLSFMCTSSVASETRIMVTQGITLIAVFKFRQLHSYQSGMLI